MSTTKNFAATKVVIPCRISFANIWEPKSINGSEEKYSVSCLIRKTDKATLDRLQKAIDAAIEDGKTRKWGGKVPPNLKLPLRDGDIDRPDDERTRRRSLTGGRIPSSTLCRSTPAATAT